MANRFIKLLFFSAITIVPIVIIFSFTQKPKNALELFFSHIITSKSPSDSNNGDLDSAFRNLRELMKNERVKNVKKFLKKNPSLINKSDANGITPLHIATYYEDKDLVTFLLKKGASPDLRTRDGITPLHIAVYKGNFEIIDALIDTKEVDINRATTEDSYTPLHIAVRFNRSRHILNELINTGANINSQTKRGRSPLHLAVIRGDVEAVKLLLNKGAHVNTFTLSSNYDAGGKTPLDEALEQGCVEIINLLKAYGAQQGNYSSTINFYQKE